jgi:cold shock CspA family protein
MMRGTMLWFNETKDLGFISTEDGEQLRVHGGGFVPGAIPKGRCAGAVVTFRVAEEEDARKAEDVSFVQEVAPRRARLRHGRFRSYSN